MSPADSHRLRLQFDWKASTLVLLLLPVMLWLGSWQLDRAEEKRQLQALFAERQLAGPMDINRLDSQADLRYQPVKLRGAYINGRTLLLDNRIFRGKFGYEVITPFQVADSDGLVLVNRGWIEGDSSRRTLPAITSVDGPVELVAQVYVPHGEMMLLGDAQQRGWPRVVQSVAVNAIATEFKQQLFPYTVRLAKESPGALQTHWLIVNLQPAKHTAYAVQWFAMAFTLLIIAFLSNTNGWALFKARHM